MRGAGKFESRRGAMRIHRLERYSSCIVRLEQPWALIFDLDHHLLLRSLLPALPLTAFTASLSEATWILIINCKYHYRWELYEYLDKEVPEKVLAVAVANASLVRDAFSTQARHGGQLP